MLTRAGVFTIKLIASHHPGVQFKGSFYALALEKYNETGKGF
jgi:hypothetical protein